MNAWGSNHIIPPHGKGGRFISTPALVRFAAKCRFDARTGCVLWEGSKCWGRGKSIRYGSFRDGPKTVLAHRWSAEYIHGFTIDGLQVDHCCPMYRAGSEPMLPDTLCVEHVQPLSGDVNRHLQTERRRHYVEINVGLRDYYEIYGEPPAVPDEAIPFYEEPKWLRRIRNGY